MLWVDRWMMIFEKDVIGYFAVVPFWAMMILPSYSSLAFWYVSLVLFWFLLVVLTIFVLLSAEVDTIERLRVVNLLYPWDDH